MAKKMKEWEGPLDDLVNISAREVSEFWVIRLRGKTYAFSGKTPIYISEGKAKGALKRHIIANFHQGHYWHKGKVNSFSKEGGHFRNGGRMGGLDKEFKVIGTETTEWLLDQDIFTIERIKI